ncbi:hypothetical protein CGZ90_17875, partial [Fictibacillus aquaticus]
MEIFSSEEHVCAEVRPLHIAEIDQSEQELPETANPLSISSYCKICGQQDFPGHNCTLVNIQQESKRTKTRRKKPLFVSLGLLLLILSACIAGAWFYIEKESNPTRVSEPFLNALKENDAKTLSKITVNSVTHTALTESEARTLSEHLKSSPDILNKVYRNIEKQEKALLKGSRTAPFIFEIKRLKEKKWKFIDQYEMVIHPVAFFVTADKEAKLFVNGNEVAAGEDGKMEVKNVLPGIFVLRAEKSNSFGSFETDQTITVWSSPADNFSLAFTDKYVTVSVPQVGMDLYVNEELYAEQVQEKEIKIGPLPEETELTIQGEIHYPWGSILSEEATARADDRVTLEFPDQENAVHNEIFESIFEFNQSYVNAITYLDSSYLQNVEDPKRSETIKTIEDLMRRNTVYRGRILNMVFDASAVTTTEENGQFFAEASVQENYSSAWMKADAAEEPESVKKSYYFIYKMRYSEEAQNWIVYQTIEKNSF